MVQWRCLAARPVSQRRENTYIHGYNLQPVECEMERKRFKDPLSLNSTIQWALGTPKANDVISEKSKALYWQQLGLWNHENLHSG